MKKHILLTVVAWFFSAAASAGVGPAWAWDANKITNNGSVQIKSTNGTTTYNAVQNPTGAVAKINQSALTQPSTLIFQATASLPIKNAGDVCTASTSGTAPNQSADEGTAITADRSTLLSCQSGVWKRTGSVGLVAYADWATVFGGRCTIKLRPNASTWYQLCYVSASNTISAYLYINGGNDLLQSFSPQFDCSTVPGWPYNAAIGTCSQVGSSMWGNPMNAAPGLSGISVYDGVAKTTTLYPWQ